MSGSTPRLTDSVSRVGLELEAVTHLVLTPNVAARVNRAVTDLDDTIEEIRTVIFDLTSRSGDRPRADG